MKLVQFSTTRRVTVAMLMTAIVAFGSVGFSRLAVNLLPDITYPTITIRTQYEGVAPQEMERLISEPIEALVSVVSNVVRVSSVSRQGFSDVVVEFAWGTNMDFASLDIREKLDLSRLPREAGKPILMRFDPSLDPIMRVVFYGGSMELRRIAEDYLRPELESLEGVAAAQVEGGLEEEIHVEILAAQLDYLGISIDQVTSRLRDENVNMTGGELKDGEAEFLVRTLNEFANIGDIENIVVGQIDGAPIRLGDVGQALRGSRDRDLITRINGLEGVEVAIFKEGDANTVQVSRELRQRLRDFVAGSSLLQAGRMEIIFDQATFIEQAVDQVLNTALIGGLLAVAILFLFLRDLKSTLIIGLSIPLSVMATFFLMFSSGISLNVMSLGGLALGIGMLVDNSIVVLESVQRCREEGLGVLEAARRGASIVGRAVIAATTTTLCVFLPIVFVEGVAGQLFRDQALTVTFSLLASLVVALMLIPMLASLSVGGESRSGGDAPGRAVAGAALVVRGARSAAAALGRVCSLLLTPAYSGFDLAYRTLERHYPRLLRWSLRHRLVVLGGVLLLALAVLQRATTLGLELIPEMSRGELLADLEWRAGTPIELTAERVGRLEAGLRDLPDVASIFTLVGTGSQSGGTAGDKKEHVAQMHIHLRPAGEEEQTLAAMREVMAAEPGLHFRLSRPSYFSYSAPVEVEIFGNHLPTLSMLADAVAENLVAIDGLTDIRSSAAGGQPEVRVVLDRQRVAEIGTTAQRIGALLRNKLQGDVATELARRDRKIDIRVRAVGDERETVADLEAMIVSPASYPIPVPLSSVATVEAVRGPAEIRRVDQERAAVVSASLEGRDLGSVVAEIEAVLADLPMPDGFSLGMGGQNEEMVRSFDSMKFALALAVFLVYLVMASQFESLVHPLVIMFTIPLGLVGSAVALLITGTTISVVVLIGLIMLAGIVVNNAIVLVDHINHLRRVEGMAKFAAVVRAGEVRFRPILMTTSTTVLGLLPMALALGEGAEIRAPMAVTVIGGLILSSALTLVLIPVVYTGLDRGR